MLSFALIAGGCGIPVLAAMGLGVGLGVDDGLVHLDADGSPDVAEENSTGGGGAAQEFHPLDFMRSRYASARSAHSAASNDSPSGDELDVDALWDIHERIRSGYLYAWSMPLTRRVLANASHLMVAAGADLGVDDQCLSSFKVGETPVDDPEARQVNMKSVVVARLARHLYSAYQRQLFDPMKEDGGIPVPESGRRKGRKHGSDNESERDDGDEESDAEQDQQESKADAPAGDGSPVVDLTSFEVCGSWAEGQPDLILQARGHGCDAHVALAGRG